MTFFALRRIIRVLWPFARRREVQWGRVREALTSPIPDENGAVFSAIGHVCFLCGLPVSDPALLWSGFGPVGFIYLHFPECATAFRDKLDTEIRRTKEGRA